MPRVKSYPRRSKPKSSATGRKVLRRMGYRNLPKMSLRRSVPIATNTAAVRENYTVSLSDGVMTFFNTRLDQPGFNRAQQVAELFQEYRIKYCKLIFRPSADTFPVGAGPIPQLYFQMNKYSSIATNATLANLLDMGCRPIRFDDKNLIRSWKPCVLLGADTANPTTLATTSQVKVSPWLSTNGLAGNPASWALSDIEHYGCVFIVTKPSPTTPTIAYNVDIEVVFQFRRPLSNQGASSNTSPHQVINGENVTLVDVSGNVVTA